MLITPVVDQSSHGNYDYILGDGSNCGGDDDDNSCNLGKVTISENEELTEHEDDEIGNNSYSCDDTMTDDAILSAGSGGKTKSKSNRHHLTTTTTASKTSDGSGHECSVGDGETCCSCSDDSCVYEEPPSHTTASQMNKNQILRVGDEQ